MFSFHAQHRKGGDSGPQFQLTDGTCKCLARDLCAVDGLGSQELRLWATCQPAVPDNPLVFARGPETSSSMKRGRAVMRAVPASTSECLSDGLNGDLRL